MGIYSESVFTTGNDPEARMPEPWCPYSATCYKARTPVHDVVPLTGKPYVDGCTRAAAKRWELSRRERDMVEYLDVLYSRKVEP